MTTEPFDDALFDKIENYLRGRLAPAEARDFEQALARDPALQEMVDLHRFERQVHEHILRDGIRRQYGDWKKKRRRRLFAAFGLAALAATAIWFFFLHPGPPPEPPPPPGPVADQPGPVDTSENVPVAPAPPDSPLEKNRPRPERSVAPPERLAADFHRASDPTRDHLRGNTSVADSAAAALLFPKNQLDEALARELLALRPGQTHPQGELREDLAHYFFKNRRYGEAATLFRTLAVDYQTYPLGVDEMNWFLLLSLIADSPAQHQAEIKGLFEHLGRAPNRRDDALRLKAALDQL